MSSHQRYVIDIINQVKKEIRKESVKKIELHESRDSNQKKNLYFFI